MSTLDVILLFFIYFQTLSRDSDSFMHDANGTYSNFFDRSQWCCYHPKVKDNWKTVLAAVVLLIVGTGISMPELIST